MLGKKVGIDLGTSTTRLVAKGEGIIASEPTVVSAHQVDVTWSYFGTTSILQRSTDGVNFVNVGDWVGPADVSRSDTGLASGQAYYYRVLAATGGGDGRERPSAACPRGASRTAPPTTTVSPARAAAGTQIRLGWGGGGSWGGIGPGGTPDGTPGRSGRASPPPSVFRRPTSDRGLPPMAK